MPKTSLPIHVRQGDVLLVRVETAIPSSAIARPTDSGRVILAYGEVTGHCHQIDTPETAMLFDVLSDEAQLTYLRVDRLSQLVHDEHSAIPLEAGTYQVIRQREYTPEEIRNVAD